MKILNKILGLFGIHHDRRDYEKDEIVRFIRDSFSTSFRFINGNRAGLSVFKTGIEELGRQLDFIESGFIASGFSVSEQPDFMVLYPLDFIGRSIEDAGNKQLFNGENESADQLRFIDITLSGIPDFFYLQLNHDGGIVPGNYYMLKMEYSRRDIDSFLWYASGSTVLRIEYDKRSIFAVYRKETEARIRTSIGSSEFSKSKHGLNSPGYVSRPGDNYNNETEIKLVIEKPKEFLAANYFIPLVTRFDRFRIKCIFDSMLIPDKKSELVSGRGTWLKVSIVISGSTYNFFYQFPGLTTEEFSERFGDRDTFFKNLLKETLLNIKSGCQGIRLDSAKYFLNEKPDSGFFSCCVILNGKFIVNYSTIEISVFVSGNLITLLNSLHLNQQEYNASAESKSDILKTMLSLNAESFRRGVKLFFNKYKGALPYMPVITRCIPFHELIDFIDERDLRIIIQNLLVPQYSSDIAMLFNIGINVSRNGEDEKSNAQLKVIRLPYNRERVEKSIPVNIKDDFFSKTIYSPASEFEKFTIKVMEDIIKAQASDRISLSYKTMYIFKNSILKILNEEHDRRLNDLKSRGIPFARMRELPENRLINLINRIESRILCLIVLESDEGLKIILDCMSSGRRRRFLEDLEYRRGLYMNFGILPENIINAILEVDNLLDKEFQSMKSL